MKPWEILGCRKKISQKTIDWGKVYHEKNILYDSFLILRHYIPYWILPTCYSINPYLLYIIIWIFCSMLKSLLFHNYFQHTIPEIKKQKKIHSMLANPFRGTIIEMSSGQFS